MGFGANAYEKDINPRSMEEKVALFSKTSEPGDKRPRPTLDDERSRENILLKETRKIDEVLVTGEM